jgi:hypothetical protein
VLRGGRLVPADHALEIALGGTAERRLRLQAAHDIAALRMRGDRDRRRIDAPRAADGGTSGERVTPTRQRLSALPPSR